jgi:hypothetical protein
MARRTVRFFVTLTLGLLVASLAVAAPPSAHIPRIGLVSVLSPAIGEAKAESFRQGLRELGYLEGRDILLETAVHHPATFAGLPGQLGVYTPMPPALTRHDLEQMLAQGLSPREMSKRTGIPRGTLQRLLKAPHVPEVLPEGRPEVAPGRPLPQSLVEAGPVLAGDGRMARGRRRPEEGFTASLRRRDTPTALVTTTARA